MLIHPHNNIVRRHYYPQLINEAAKDKSSWLKARK